MRGFAGASRNLIEEDEIALTSVGVDIGSSTCHLIFSTITLLREGNRYVVAGRRVIHESDIMLTPYRDGEEIDAEVLAQFIDEVYAQADCGPDEVDTGAVILTGVAARRRNARRIGEIFSAQAGKFVSASAGDGLETLISAHGSGAAGLSKTLQEPVLNVDVGGGTTKLALCVNGKVVDMTALDAGARLVVRDKNNLIKSVEPYGRDYLRELGLAHEPGALLEDEKCRALACLMADRILMALSGSDDPELKGLLRLPPMQKIDQSPHVIFSGGVSEYLYGRANGVFGDLGPFLADALRERFASIDACVHEVAGGGIRATVVGASQFTVQVSGSTIFFTPEDILPVRNVPVVLPEYQLDETVPDIDAMSDSIRNALLQQDLQHGEQAVALSLAWAGSATFDRLRAISRGILQGLAPVLQHEHPLILVLDKDLGGLIGLHLCEEEDYAGGLISIDGIESQAFDFIDIGEVLHSTGAAPVVIKSLIFPTSES
jgi:ethanolamine utilization protein EutA